MSNAVTGRALEQPHEAPKAFMSYSWSSPEHQEWVLALSRDLEESGVHVIIDKWDLREGADKYAYMEKMVTDATIRKVIVICDSQYAEKSDKRVGGVGTEAQIISPEIYAQINATDQVQKFVAVITEKDETGKPFVPAFLKSRIYIDMSEPEARTQNLEQLVRWIFDKPLHERPERGKPPSYLSDDDKISLNTSSRFRHAVEALKQNKISAPAAVRDYFDTFIGNLESFRIEGDVGHEFDEKVMASIEAFRPYRDEAVDLVQTLIRHRSDAEMYETLRAFFESLLPFTLWPAGQSTWYDVGADNFKFVINELFLYAVAALIKESKFNGVNHLLERGYYVRPGSPDLRDGGLLPFTMFDFYLKSFTHRNERLKLQKLSLAATTIKERANRRDLTFEDLMQADLVLYLRDQLSSKEDHLRSWFPDTLVYTEFRSQPFEIFVRAESERYFDLMKAAVGVTSKDALKSFVEQSKSGTSDLRWKYQTVSVHRLINIERLATKP